jgi:hypothetical protein
VGCGDVMSSLAGYFYADLGVRKSNTAVLLYKFHVWTAQYDGIPGAAIPGEW